VDVVDNLSSGSLSNLARLGPTAAALQFSQLDVRSPDIIDLMVRRKPEVVFHLAARSTCGSR